MNYYKEAAGIEVSFDFFFFDKSKVMYYFPFLHSSCTKLISMLKMITETFNTVLTIVNLFSQLSIFM